MNPELEALLRRALRQAEFSYITWREDARAHPGDAHVERERAEASAVVQALRAQIGEE